MSDLTSATTCDLVEELKKRAGVETIVLECGEFLSGDSSDLEGPMIILLVTD